MRVSCAACTLERRSLLLNWPFERFGHQHGHDVDAFFQKGLRFIGAGFSADAALSDFAIVDFARFLRKLVAHIIRVGNNAFGKREPRGGQIRVKFWRGNHRLF